MIVTGFHEVRFPDNIAYGATGGPGFATTVVATSAGHEKRNVSWAEARGRWDAGSGLKNQQQLDELIAFFRARRGSGTSEESELEVTREPQSTAAIVQLAATGPREVAFPSERTPGQWRRARRQAATS